ITQCETVVTHLDLHSFPTRRSSDLIVVVLDTEVGAVRFRASPRLKVCEPALTVTPVFRFTKTIMTPELPCAANACDNSGVKCFRSEEHTSELQSRENLVCRLLLEKK